MAYSKVIAALFTVGCLSCPSFALSNDCPQNTISPVFSSSRTLETTLSQDCFLDFGSNGNVDMDVALQTETSSVSFDGQPSLSDKSPSKTSSTLAVPTDLILSGKCLLSKTVSLIGQVKGSDGLKSVGIEYCPVTGISLYSGWKEVRMANARQVFSSGISVISKGSKMNFSSTDGAYGVSMDLDL